MQANSLNILHACEKGDKVQSLVKYPPEEIPLSCYSAIEEGNYTENGSVEVPRGSGSGCMQFRETFNGPNGVEASPVMLHSPRKGYDSVDMTNLTTDYRPMTSPTVGDPEYEYVLCILNPGSGERGAAEHVLDSMRAVIGADRVVTLDAALFANPTPILEAIRRHAVRSICQDRKKSTLMGVTDGGKSGTDTCGDGVHGQELERRGTVIVCGGDGTVSFVMEQLDAVRDMMQRMEADSVEAGAGTKDGVVKPRFLLPAVAVLALGTGNDYSNCVGFGNGYSRHKLSCFCCCMENAIEPIIRNVLSAPAVPFDRWKVQLVPLTAIWKQQERQCQQQQTSHLTLVTKHEEGVLSETPPEGEMEEKKREEEEQKEEETVTEDLVDLYALDWDALEADETCRKFNFINYFSIGFDAYVLQKFDFFRRKHPKFCSTRMNNKLVYGMYGLKAVTRCSSLRPCIPQIWVPQLAKRFPIHTTASRRSSGQTMETESMMHLSLPKGSKTLLITNVGSYAAGTRPWKEGKGKLYRDDHLAQPMIITPVCVNDHKMEVQSVGGIFQMGLLQLGIGKGASKLAQTREMFAFVLCNPTDIARREKLENGEEMMAGKEGVEDHTPLCMQLDGEAIGRINCPTVVHITELLRPRVYVRCRNPRVIRHPIEDEEEAF
ncbi:diacylglycerol kinase, putative [Trypanosoma cruzi marinkellei]|uniref:Diacylglycerol kinase n=1 Tax=Trypanosoma cruzi marinkellei TaxID=85056 RepID=K2MG34_TRYCR|nr:diacylglycerol kinase, putative [Trypanosoma cruzi marinkellei]